MFQRFIPPAAVVCVVGVAAGYLLLAGGCGSRPPVGLVPVTGKVTYDDGSLIQAERISIIFAPQGMQTGDGMPVSPSHGSVNVADGSFTLSTWSRQGAPVGKFKVAVGAFGENKRYVLAKVLSDPQKTPLTAEVVGDEPNVIHIKVPKKT